MVDEVVDEVELLNCLCHGHKCSSCCAFCCICCACACAETRKARLPAGAGFLWLVEGIHFWSLGSWAGCCSTSLAAAVDGRLSDYVPALGSLMLNYRIPGWKGQGSSGLTFCVMTQIRCPSTLSR